MSGRIAEARALFERGASLLPQQIPVWLGLGWTALFQQDLGGARSAFETALDLDPNSAESHGALAMVAAIEGRRDEALASIRRAVELDPDTWSIKFAQGVLDGQQADPQAILSSVQANSGKHATTDNRPSTVPIPSGRNVH
jgi:Flp pilus assembly protein TadD